MVVAILAGGLATRLRPLTENIPKSLVPIAGRPFVDYQLELVARAGVTDVVLCVGYLGDQVRAHCGDGRRYGLRIVYSADGPALRGTGGALLHAVPFLPETFFVLYGDSYLPCPYREIWDAFCRSGARGLMTAYENHDRYDRSNVAVGDGRVRVYDKTQQTSGLRFIDYGLSAFRKDVLAEIPQHTAFDLSALHQALIARGELHAYEVRERFYEVGSPAGLSEFQALVQSGILVRSPLPRS